MLLFGSPRPPFRFQRKIFSATGQIVDLQCFAGDRVDGLSGSFRFFQESSADLRRTSRLEAYGLVRFCAVPVGLRMVPSGGVQWLFGNCSAIGRLR